MLYEVDFMGEFEEWLSNEATTAPVALNFEENIDSYVKIVKEYEAAVKAISDEIKALQAKKKRNVEEAERMRGWIEANLKATGKKKIKGTIFTVSMRKGAPKLPEDLSEYDIPKEYFVEQEPKINRVELLADIKKGKVKGIGLITEDSFSIR